MSIHAPNSVRSPGSVRLGPRRAMPALMSACVVVVVAKVAAVNLALPKLSCSELHPSSTELLWIVDAYILVFGCLLIPSGALGDRVRAHGESGITARLDPATIDGLVYASSIVILYAARHRAPVPSLARWLLGLGIAATLMANMARGWSHDPVGAVVAAWPAVSLVGSASASRVAVVSRAVVLRACSSSRWLVSRSRARVSALVKVAQPALDWLSQRSF